MIEQALLYLAGAFFGTLGFAVLTRVPRRTLLAAGGIEAVVYMVYWLLSLAGLSEHTAVFFGTTVGSVLGHLCARKMRVINTVFLMSAIVPVVPGLGLYRMMAALGQGQLSSGAELGIRAMITVAMIALGVGAGAFLDRVLWSRGKESRGHVH